MLLLSENPPILPLVIWILGLGLMFLAGLKTSEEDKELRQTLIIIGILLMIVGCGVCTASATRY